MSKIIDSINKEDYSVILMYLSALSEGKDPTCGIPFAEDTILNNKQIQKRLQQALLLLTYYMEIGSQVHKKKRGSHSFKIAKSQLFEFHYSDDPISISELTYRLNGTLKSNGMCNLKATDLTSLLVKVGYLYEKTAESGNKTKLPTEVGEKAGITYIQKKNSRDEIYYTCLYSKAAQEMVLTILASET